MFCVNDVRQWSVLMMCVNGSGGGDCLPSLNRVKNARNANNARSASNASRRKPPQGVVENREQPQTVVEHY